MKNLEFIKNKIEKDELFSIVCYGTSTTSFEFVFPNWSEIIRYVLKSELENISEWKFVYWNFQITNRGLSGATSEELKDRFESLVVESKPDMVFLGAGDNDYLLGIDKDIVIKNMVEMVEKLLNNNIKIVFTTIIPSVKENINIKEYIELDKKIADLYKYNENFIFVNLFELFPRDLLKNTYTLLAPDENDFINCKKGDLDYIHYKRFGNAIVAKILLKEVFDINFDENKFLKDLGDNTKKYPEY